MFALSKYHSIIVWSRPLARAFVTINVIVRLSPLRFGVSIGNVAVKLKSTCAEKTVAMLLGVQGV